MTFLRVYAVISPIRGCQISNVAHAHLGYSISKEYFFCKQNTDMQNIN